MTNISGQEPTDIDVPLNDRVLGMYSDSVGFPVSDLDSLTPEEQLTAGVEVQSRLDMVSDQLGIMVRGGKADIDEFNDPAVLVVLKDALTAWIDYQVEVANQGGLVDTEAFREVLAQLDILKIVA